MSEHPARSLQIALVGEEMTQKEKLFVGALAGNLRQHIAGMAADSFIIHLREVAKARYPLLSPKSKLLLHQAHCLRIVILEEAHNGVALSKHRSYSVLLKCMERKPPRASLTKVG